MWTSLCDLPCASKVGLPRGDLRFYCRVQLSLIFLAGARNAIYSIEERGEGTGEERNGIGPMAFPASRTNPLTSSKVFLKQQTKIDWTKEES